MKTIALEELQANPIAILSAADDLIITKNNRPYRLVSRLDEGILDDVWLLQHPAIQETIRLSEANLAAGRYCSIDDLLETYYHELPDPNS